MTPTVSAESLDGGYGKHQILYGVDFEAGDEVTAVIGSNGSGKSTLLKSVCGIADVYSGAVRLRGREITGLPTHRIMRDMSYMPQTDNVFAALTVRENLEIASMPGSTDWAFVSDMFPMLEPRAGERAGSLSGGQRQMLAMAMCTCTRPGVLLLDEPTAGLSPRAAGEVLAKISEIQESMGNCVILVEQNVRGALDMCDACCLLAGGKKIYHGTPAGLLADPEFDRKFLGMDI